MTESEKNNIQIAKVLARLLIYITLIVVSIICLFQQGYGWFAANHTVTGNGLGVSVVDAGSMSFDAAYAGKFVLNDNEINFNIDESLFVYPQNYITVKFSVLDDAEDFQIYVQQHKLPQDEFYAYFASHTEGEGELVSRRDLLLGEYTLDETANIVFDPESVFSYVSYSDGYASVVNSLPSRPEISMTVGQESAFNVAYSNYLENSLPYLTELLYRFEQQNSLFNALSFVLYVMEEGTPTQQYLMLPQGEPDTDGGMNYAPKYTRPNDDPDWAPFEDSLILRANQGNDELIYALVTGYGVEYYEEELVDGVLTLVKKEPLHPKVILESGEEMTFGVPAGCQTVVPYQGTLYSNNYNCFIGSSVAVKFVKSESVDSGE